MSTFKTIFIHTFWQKKRRPLPKKNKKTNTKNYYLLHYKQATTQTNTQN